MRSLGIVWILLGLLLGAGCISSAGARHKLGWRTLSRGLTSGLVDESRSVIRDEGEFLRLWALHAADVNRPALPPVVDFEREMVLVVSMGEQPTGGYLTEVVEMELRGRTLRVLVGERLPKAGTVQVQRPTQPFQFVAIPRMEGRVEFRTVREAKPTAAGEPPVREREARSARRGTADARVGSPKANSNDPTGRP